MVLSDIFFQKKLIRPWLDLNLEPTNRSKHSNELYSLHCKEGLEKVELFSIDKHNILSALKLYIAYSWNKSWGYKCYHTLVLLIAWVVSKLSLWYCNFRESHSDLLNRDLHDRLPEEPGKDYQTAIWVRL